VAAVKRAAGRRYLNEREKLEWEVFMGKTFWATAVMIGFAVVANAAPQSLHKDGAVVQVDRAGKSLTVQSGFGNSIYKTTDHTMFLVGTAPTNWAAVKIGEKVGINYHLNGRNQVADEVEIGG
jgi:hypothetical protein